MGGKYALVIGNSRYDDLALSKLTTPWRDAEKLAEVLESPEIGGFDQVIKQVDQPEAILRRAIARFFANRQRDDFLMLYFSGHGVLDDQGLLYFASRDTEHTSLSATAIPASFIRQEMDHSYSRRQVLVLDCCHSGAFGRGAKGVLGASVGTATRFEVEGYGRVVLTASDSTQYAWEGDQLAGQAENSLFTHFLVEGLRTGKADQNGDGKIEADEWYDYAYRQVLQVTPKQKPQKFTDRMEGPLFIARNPSGATRQAELPAELGQSAAQALPAPARTPAQASSLPLSPAPSIPSTRAPSASPARTPSRKTVRRFPWIWIGAGGLIALLGIIGVGFLLAGLYNNLLATPTMAAVEMKTKTIAPAIAPIVSMSPETFTPTAPIFTSEPSTPVPATSTSESSTSQPPATTLVSLPVRITDPNGVEMALIPEGEFLMGSTDADKEAKNNEKPQHPVYLNDFYMDLTEVTNGMYRDCVDSGVCTPPHSMSSISRSSYYGNPDFVHYPVIHVDWEQARVYCEWRQARLPTEAEWEKAARGRDGRIYPWGEKPDCIYANVSECVGDTSRVGNTPAGGSPFGISDMAGNVWEWVQDWYSDKFYQPLLSGNPTGPSTGKNRVMRGGSAGSTWENARAANRSWRAPDDWNQFIGFRCAR